MKIILLTIALFASAHLYAQNKINVDLSATVLQSIGRDIPATYTSDANPLIIKYFSRSKFKHPYFNVLGHVSYPVSSKVGIGLQSGFYFHYRENYFSGIQRTSLSIPVMATFSYQLFNFSSNELGIMVAAGKIFYNTDDSEFKINNGALYNTSVFFNINNKSLIKFGVEKQIDNVSVTVPDYKNETFRYHLKRIALMLSYSIRIGK